MKMPCEIVSRTVNNSYITSELEVDNSEKRSMYEEKLELNKPVTSSFSLERGRRQRKYQEECCREGFDEKLNPKKFQKEIQYQVFGYRTLPRVFSALGDFGAIKETESAIDDVCVSSKLGSVPHLQQSHNSRRKSTTNVTSKTKFDVGWLAYSSPKNNHRRSSEGSLVSAREDLGLGKYQKYSEGILNDQRSERKDSIDILEQINSTGEIGLVNDHSRRSSFAAMDVIPETLSDSKRFYSLPRKLSLPVENRRSTANWNGKKQRNSLPTNSNNSGTPALDNDTDIQWKMLVARAKNFQKLSSREPENTYSKVEKTDDVKMRKGATGFHTKNGDQNVGSICESQDIEAKDNDESVGTTQRSTSQENIKSIKSSDEIETKESSSVSLEKKEVAKSGQVDLTVKNVPLKHDIDLQHQTDRNNRRYSLATVRPPQEVREKISGYSTHGALEYARMLLGKIQSEGKSKSKKERLDEMSKALKMVLEELNRIDLPDRELVSLFVSLRAEIVNLRAELKAEEKHELTTNDKQTENDVKVLSKTLPRTRSASESGTTQPNFRRFSWC